MNIVTVRPVDLCFDKPMARISDVEQSISPNDIPYSLFYNYSTRTKVVL